MGAVGALVAVCGQWRYRAEVVPRRRPTEQDRVEATRRFLSGLANGDDVFELSSATGELHPKTNTFPGERENASSG